MRICFLTIAKFLSCAIRRKNQILLGSKCQKAKKSFQYKSMTLAEFDAIRQYLPPETEVTIVTESTRGPGTDEEWAIWDCSWGNHDGRFNVMCRACGWSTPDIPARMKEETLKTYLHKPCPKCGRRIIKKEDIKK